MKGRQFKGQGARPQIQSLALGPSPSIGLSDMIGLVLLEVATISLKTTWEQPLPHRLNQ